MERETPYSPRQRTALVLTGTGTAGAYHAGVLRALHEAGVKIDLVAGRGIGAVGALFAAVDAAPRLWEANGLWLGAKRTIDGLYEWRLVWRLAGWALVAACVSLFLPIAALVLGAIVYPLLLLFELIAPAAAGAMTLKLTTALSEAFSGGLLSAVVSRVATAALLVFVGALAYGFFSDRWRRPRRRTIGAPWWQALGAPISTQRAVAWAMNGFWGVLHGATSVPKPPADALSQRYSELLAENLGQPGYRELILAAHDLDTRRDLIFGLIGGDTRARFFGNGVATEDGRRAELVDLAGGGARHAMDAIAAALSVPMLTEPHLMTFGTDTFWRGESHRLCDRPASLVRLLEEVSAAGAEQVILVSADAPLSRAHALAARQMDPRAMVADYIAGEETAATRDALTALFDRFSGLFQIQPTHNPLGPFAFAGAYDERSDRVQPLGELLERGYEDAYRQFIEPVVGASGEQLEQRDLDRPSRPLDPPDGSAPISEMLAGLD